MMMSFVIPAHNEELYLGKTLDRLIDSAEAVKEPYEIIVVADGCTDDTTAVARKHKSRVIEVQRRQIARRPGDLVRAAAFGHRHTIRPWRS